MAGQCVYVAEQYRGAGVVSYLRKKGVMTGFPLSWHSLMWSGSSCADHPAATSGLDPRGYV